MKYLSLKDKQVNCDEFQKYTGKDLRLYLDASAEEVEIVIYRKQLSCDTFMESHFFQRADDEYTRMTEFQKTHYKIGVMEQILFELRNGELTTDSGYNGEIGAVIHRDYLDYISFSREARNHFALCGLWKRKISGEGIFNFGGYYD